MEEITLKGVVNRSRKPIFWICNVIIAIMSYGFALFTNSIGVDDESIQTYLSGALISQGRIGMNITNSIFSLETYLPFFYLFVGLILLIISNYLITNIFYYISKGKFDEKSSIIYSIAILSFPNFSYAFIFTMTQFQTGIIFILLSFAIYFGYKYVVCDGNVINLLLNVLILSFILSGSEAMIITYALVSMFLLILLLYDSVIEFKQLVRYGVKYITIVILSLILWKMGQYVIYHLLNIEPSGYLDGYFKYQAGNFVDVFKNIFIQLIEYILKAERLTALFRIISILGLLLLCIKLSQKRNTCVPIFIFIIIIIGAFSLVLVTGNFDMPKRVSTFLAPFFAFSLSSIDLVLKESKMHLLKIIFNFFVVILIYYQTQMCNITIYNDYLQCQLDYQKAYTILNDIQKETDTYNSKPVVFVGVPDSYNLPVNANIGIDSIFRQDRVGNNSFVNGRIYRFYKQIGFVLKEGTQDLYNESVNVANDMSEYPKNGYIKELDDVIVVKLGDVEYISKFNNNIGNAKNYKLTRNSCDSFNVYNNQLFANGWGIVNEVSSEEVKKKLILTNINTNDMYMINIKNTNRNDISVFYKTNNLYDKSGYEINIDLSNVSKGKYNVKLYLYYNNDFYDTDFHKELEVK